MADPPSGVADVREVLTLARRDRSAAGKALAELGADEQLALVLDAPVGSRAELLDLVPTPELVVPRLPEAEFCFTVKALGVESATWLLEYATREQMVAALDLDIWDGQTADPAKLGTWIDALAETSDESLLSKGLGIDPELMVLYLKRVVAVVQKPDDAEGWDPPAGGQTLDGQFYVCALREDDDLASLLHLLRVFFQGDYWTYFRLLQGVIWELPTENEEWALRWRAGRLEDMGFPRWEEAMHLYAHLRPEERAAIPESRSALQISEWHLPVWIPTLPEGADSRHLVFRTLSRMEAEERRGAFYAFVAIANQVAVADRMELSDLETTPRAIDKAALWISRGLEYVARENALADDEVLRRLPMQRLFQVGVNLDPDAARG